MITNYHVLVEILFRRKGFLTIQNTFQIILTKLTTVLNLWQFFYLFQITGRMIVFNVKHNSFMFLLISVGDLVPSPTLLMLKNLSTMIAHTGGRYFKTFKNDFAFGRKFRQKMLWQVLLLKGFRLIVHLHMGEHYMPTVETLLTDKT